MSNTLDPTSEQLEEAPVPATVEGAVDTTRASAADVAAKTDPDPSSMNLEELMAKLDRESDSSPEAEKKLRKLEMMMMYFARVYPGFDREDLKDKVFFKPLSGNAVGETFNSYVVVDPILTTKDDLELLRHTLGHEYFEHLKKGTDHEGLTEAGVMVKQQVEALDYFDLVANVMPVIENVGDGDKNKGFDKVVGLYNAGKYDDLFEEFKTAYDRRNPAKVAQNKDAAFHVFQLAFPSLQFADSDFTRDPKIHTDFAEEPFEE